MKKRINVYYKDKLVGHFDTELATWQEVVQDFIQNFFFEWPENKHWTRHSRESYKEIRP